jgi:Integrase core domain.
MIHFMSAVLAGLAAFFRSRADFALEILALRQQVAVLKRKRLRPPLNSSDRLFWVLLQRFWPGWKSALIIVKPDTVVGWHRAGFRYYWSWKCRRHPGRPRISTEIRELIVRLAEENTGWGAPKIHGELLKLGFEISERTVARYLRRLHRRGDPKKSWPTFLKNHREVIVALDFFTVPTITFRLLYCFFVIEHERRKILHCNVTAHPTADWVLQQLRQTFTGDEPYRYVILDHDAKFNAEMMMFLKSTGLKPKRTSIQAPWQNGTAERWVGSARREILDHVIALNEGHLRRLLREYIAYHQEDRIHDALGKETPNHRPVEHRPSPTAVVVSGARLGGLHHRYSWREAA